MVEVEALSGRTREVGDRPDSGLVPAGPRREGELSKYNRPAAQLGSIAILRIY